MGHIEIQKVRRSSAFRKVAMGSWKTVGDPSVYAFIDVDMTNSIAFMKQQNETHGVKLTPTHLVGAAAAHALFKRPELNAMIRGWRIYQRKHVDLFFQVNIPGDGKDKTAKADLSGAVIEASENLSALDIARKLKEKVDRARARKDQEIAKQMNIIKSMPWFFVRWFLNITSWLIYGVNRNLKFLGLPKDPFGSVMITNIGSMGVDLALAPLVPYTRVPFLITVGVVREKPVVVDAAVVPRPVMTLGITFDHRLVDGVHMAEMNHIFRHSFEEPEKYFLSPPSRV